MSPLDERPRFLLALRLGGEFLRLLDSLCRGPAKSLRLAVDSDGVPLFECADVGTSELWVPAGNLIEVMRAIRAAAPLRTCPHCHGAKCGRCRHLGYEPEQIKDLARQPAAATLPFSGDVADVWGWINQGGE